MELRGATALLTGASSGIGPTIARTLHERGARLIVTGRNQVQLRRIGDELGARGVVADLANAHELDQLASEVGDVDVLVANAALPGAGEVLSLPQPDIDRVLDVNLRAAITLSRALAPLMVEH